MNILGTSCAISQPQVISAKRLLCHESTVLSSVGVRIIDILLSLRMQEYILDDDNARVRLALEDVSLTYAIDVLVKALVTCA